MLLIEDEDFDVLTPRRLKLDINETALITPDRSAKLNIAPIEYSEDDDGVTTVHIDNEYFDRRGSYMSDISSSVEIFTLDEVIE